jgi:hypothetical protein
MARITHDDFSNQTGSNNENKIEIDALGKDTIEVPNSQFISDSEIARDGQDLVLETPDGQSLVIQNYFNAEGSPLIESTDGAILTENLVNSFLNSNQQFAQNGSINDESPIGAVEEMSGSATVSRVDGTSESLTLGSPIYQGDTIETSDSGAVNIVFIDETSMAVSENSRLSVDEYQFDPSTESGTTNLSVLRGVFVFTSGLIGRDDPDDVLIDTPVGSIGIRGTIIAGKINPGGESEITVVEGAIVVKNGVMETTLSQQYESVRLGGFNENMQDIGVQKAENVGKTYGSVSDVAPKLFSSINDNIKQEQSNAEKTVKEESTEEVLDAKEEIPEAEELQEEVKQEPLADPIANPEFQSALEGLLPHEMGEHKNNSKEDNRFNEHRNSKSFKHLGHDPLNPDIFEDQPLTLNHSSMELFENTKAGQVIGRAQAEEGANGSVSFTFENGSTTSADGYFELDQTGGRVVEIKLTSAGETALNSAGIGGVGSPLSSPFRIIVTDQNNQNNHIELSPQILDAAVHLNIPGGTKRFTVSNGSNLGPQKIGDFNGDGTTDHVALNTTANTVQIIDGSTNSPIGTLLTGASGTTANSIDGVGDINNDGYADFVYGSPTAGTAGEYTVVNGMASSHSTSTLTPGSPADAVGTSVAGIGDVDGDGKSDYAVSAPGVDTGGVNRGAVIYQYGNGSNTATVGHVNNMELGSHVAGLGDVNGDGFSDIIITAENNVGGNYEAYILTGSAGGITTTTAGQITISTPYEIVAGGAVGDINGDGFDDIAISLKMGADINTFIIGGLTSLPGTIDMTFLEDPSKALKLHHSGAGGAAHYQVTALGDTNGDGLDDIQLGVVGGQQFVVHGSVVGGGAYVVDGTATDGAGSLGSPDGVVGATGNNQALVGDVHFMDNAYNNLSMKGGAGENTFGIQTNNFRSIDGGNGVEDTIRHGNGGGELDFSSVNFEQIDQIEKIELTQTGAAIKLTAENIFNLLKTSDNGSLTIELGSSGNIDALNGSLQIDDLNTVTGSDVHDEIVNALNGNGSGATHNGTVVQNGETYDHYQIGGYNLYIDTDVATTVV